MSLVDQVVLLSLFAGTVGLIVVIVLTGWWIMPKAPSSARSQPMADGCGL